MGLVLQIIGGLVLLVIALAVIAFFVLQWKIKKLASELGSLTGMGGMNGVPPMRMRLRPTNAEQWEYPDVQESVLAFDHLGFDRIAAYESPDMPGLIILPYASPDNKCYAVVYHHPGGLGVWCDIFTKYEDGASLTVTNAARGGELEHRPGNEKAYLPGSAVDQLVDVHVSKLRDKAVRPATIEGFAQDFERAYEEEMAWRVTKSYSDEEVRAVAALDGGDFSDEVLEETREALNEQANVKLSEVMRRKYLEEGGVTAAEWEDQRDRLVIIHDRMTIANVLDATEEWRDDLELDGQYLSEQQSEEPRAFMDRLNEAQSEETKFKKVRSFHEPVEADIWLAPFDEEF